MNEKDLKICLLYLFGSRTKIGAKIEDTLFEKPIHILYVVGNKKRLKERTENKYVKVADGAVIPEEEKNIICINLSSHVLEKNGKKYFKIQDFIQTYIHELFHVVFKSEGIDIEIQEKYLKFIEKYNKGKGYLRI